MTDSALLRARSLLTDMPIGRKIVGLSVAILSLMLAAAIYAFVQTSQVHSFTSELTETLEPLAHEVEAVESETLGEALLVERALRHAGPQVPRAAEGQAEYERFQTLSATVSKRLRDAEAIVKAGAEHAKSPEIADRLSELTPEIETVRREHARYDAAAVALFQSRDRSPQEQAVSEALFSAEEGQLEEALKRLSARIRALTSMEEQALGSLEDRAFLISSENLGVAIFAFLAGTLMSAMITRRMLRPVRALIAGTEQVGQGNFDVTLPQTGRDEIGRLSGAFGRMVIDLKSQAAIRDTFGSYIDRRIVDRLLSDGRDAVEAGERREMTIMFADLQGFSGISETLTPTALVKLINRYLAMVSEPISEHQGVIDKYIGDAVMAFWGAPFTEDAYAVRAGEAALALNRKMDRLRRMLPDLLGLRRDLPEIKIRIGIATGDVVVGSIGAKTSKSFTVIGDSVNLASRLEGANKFYGTSILVDEATYAQIGGEIAAREIDMIAVAGKQETTRIFELLDPAGAHASRTAMLDAFGAGLAAYRERNWDEAARLFDLARNASPADAPSRIFSERVAFLRANDPGPDWDAVWRHDRK